VGEREDILVGYQLLARTNVADTGLVHSASYLKSQDPITKEQLIVAVAPTVIGGPEIPTRIATVDDIKRLTEKACVMSSVESWKARNFIQKWPDAGMIQRGTEYFGGTEKMVNDDLAELAIHPDNTLLAINTELSKVDLLDVGNLLGLYDPAVPKVSLRPDMVSKEHKHLNIRQDLLNAMSFELIGLKQSTGEPSGLSFAQLVELAKARILTYERTNLAAVDTAWMDAVKDYVKEALKDCKKVDDLKALSDYINANVPHLPNVRRHWSL